MGVRAATRSRVMDGLQLLLCVALLGACALPGASAVGEASTLSGGNGPGNTDGAESIAQFNGPKGLAYSLSLNKVFVADDLNFAIREVDGTTGTTATLAGSPGTQGEVDGTGSAARFFYVADVVLSADESVLYVADQGNGLIRSVATDTGVVTTIAGAIGGGFGAVDGAASVARFNNPTSLARHCDTLYVADYSNYAIRAVDLTTGDVTTVAGMLTGQGTGDGALGTAKLYSPISIALSEDTSTLYVAEVQSHKIRTVNLGDGSISTLTGTLNSPGAVNGLSPLLNEPYGMAERDGLLYFVERVNHAVRTLELATGDVTTFAGTLGTSGSDDGASALFFKPQGIYAWENILYIADADNDAIRTVDLQDRFEDDIESPPEGEVSTLAGNNGVGAVNGRHDVSSFDDPVDVACPTLGDVVYVADSLNHVIRAINRTTGYVSTLSGALCAGSGAVDGDALEARYNTPMSVALSEDEATLFVADRHNHVIRSIDLGSGVVSTLVGSLGAGSGAVDGTGTVARFNSPAGVAVRCSTLYVSEYSGCVIRAVEIDTGVVTTLSGTLGAGPGAVDGAAAVARFSNPYLMAPSEDGLILYVADTSNQAVRAVDTLTGETSTVAGLLGTSGAVDGDSGTARFDQPYGLIARGGNLLISERNNHAIRELDLVTGDVTTFAGLLDDPDLVDDVFSVSRFNRPLGMCLSGDTLFVADRVNRAIRELTLPEVPAAPAITEGIVTTIAGRFGGGTGAADGCAIDARFSNPLDAAFTSASSVLYVADKGNHAIRQIDTATGEVSTLAGELGTSGAVDGSATSARFNQPFGCVLSADELTLYVADTYNDVIRSVDVDTGDVSTLAGTLGAGPGAVNSGSAGAVRFDKPLGLAFHADVLYVCDEQNRVIRTVDVTNGATATLAGTFGSIGSVDGAFDVALFSLPNRALVSEDGLILYVTDPMLYAIRAVTIDTGDVTTFAGLMGTSGADDGPLADARFTWPFGLARIGTTLYVTDDNAVRAVDLTAGAVSTLSGEVGTSGAGAVDGNLIEARFESAMGIAAASDTALYLADQNHVLRRVLLPVPPAQVKQCKLPARSSRPYCAACACGGSIRERMKARIVSAQ